MNVLAKNMLRQHVAKQRARVDYLRSENARLNRLLNDEAASRVNQSAVWSEERRQHDALIAHLREG